MRFHEVILSDNISDLMYNVDGVDNNTKVNYTAVWTALQDNTKVAYLPEKHDTIDRYDMTDEEKKKYGVMTKPGKFIGKLLFKDADKEVCTRFTKMFLAGKNGFDLKLVSGEDIRKYYHQDNYSSISGSLGASCMRYGDCQSWLDIYTENYNVKMLIAVEESGTIVGRALVWSGVTIGEHSDAIFMDRIYSTNENFEEDFKIYAKDNSWWFKARQSYDNDSTYSPVDKYTCEWDECISCKIENSCHDYYPFLDTLCTLNDSCLYSEKSNMSGIELRETDGCSSNAYIVCYHCGDRESEDEVIECDGEYYCSYCARNQLLTCSKCDKYLVEDTGTTVDNKEYCDNCAPYHETCSYCSDNVTISYESVDGALCEYCIDKYEMCKCGIFGCECSKEENEI